MFAKCVLLVLCLPCLALADSDDKFVKVLTDKNFDKFVKKGTTWMVEFYAPWCGHCKNLEPVWASAAAALDKTSETKLAKVDATANPALTRRFSIQGYPSIKLFKDGRYRGDYSGGRTESEIIRFAKQASGSAVVTVGEDDSVTGFVGEQDISFVLVGVSAGNVPTIKAFEKVADDEVVFGNVGFGIVPSLEAFNEFLKDEDKNLVLPGPALVVVNTGEVSFISTQGDNPLKLDQKNIEKFVADNKVPFYPELSPSKNWKLTKEGKKTVLGFVDQSKAGTGEFIELMKQLKREMGSKLVFGWVDAPSNTFLLEPIGITLESLPKFVVVDISAMTYFKSPSFATEKDEIKTFLQRVVDGKETALPINEKKGEDKKPEAAAPSGGSGSGVSQEVVNALEKKITDLFTRVTQLEATVASNAAFATTVTGVLGAGLVGLLALFFTKSSGGRKEEQAPAAAAAASDSRKRK